MEETTGFLLAKVCRAHRTGLGALLAPLGLHVGQEMVLLELWREDGLRGGELAERLGVEPPTMTRTLRRLESCGLVKRQPDPEDARSTRFHLTEEGRALRAPVDDLWNRVETRVVAGMTAGEEVLLRGLLLKVRQNLEAGSAGDRVRPCDRARTSETGEK